MIHIEKNPVLHANEYYNIIGYGPAAKTKIQQELDQKAGEYPKAGGRLGHRERSRHEVQYRDAQ